MNKSTNLGAGPQGLTRRTGTSGPGIAMSPVRVIVTPVSTPLDHPLSKRDVQRILSVLPGESTLDLRSVSLLGDVVTAAGYPVLASYRRRGFIRLHAVSTLPWRIRSLNADQVADLVRFGAHVDAGPDECVVRWSRPALRLFFTVAALLPGVARHRRERDGYAESSMIIRSLADDLGAWQVSDMALEQWRAFLEDGDGAKTPPPPVM